MSVHGYGYYDICTQSVNIRVLKILVPVTYGYLFIISIFYPLRVLFTNMNFFTSLIISVKKIHIKSIILREMNGKDMHVCQIYL